MSHYSQFDHNHEVFQPSHKTFRLQFHLFCANFYCGSPGERPLLTSIRWPACVSFLVDQKALKNSHLLFTSFKTKHTRQDVHHPGSPTNGCCLRCSELLSLVHIPPPPIRPCLRGTRGWQGCFPWFHVRSYRPSLIVLNCPCCSSMCALVIISYFPFVYAFKTMCAG